MNYTVRIFTQYYENYSDTNTPYWKPKGGQEFNLNVDVDLMMYDKDMAVDAIKSLLEERSNESVKYEYLDHEILFSEPITMSRERFEERMMQLHILAEENKSK